MSLRGAFLALLVGHAWCATAEPVQTSAGLTVGVESDSRDGWRVAPGLRADLSFGRTTTEDVGGGIMVRADAPAVSVIRGGLAPQLIVPVAGGAAASIAAGPLWTSDGLASFARVELGSKSPNRHGHYGIHLGVFLEASARRGWRPDDAIQAGITVDFGLLALPVLAAARPMGSP